MTPFWKHVTRSVVAIGVVGALGACSTVDRLGKNDHSVYAGTRASTTGPDRSTVDTVFSAIGDTILLPYTGIRYLFGYRYDESMPVSSLQSRESNAGSAQR